MGKYLPIASIFIGMFQIFSRKQNKLFLSNTKLLGKLQQISMQWAKFAPTGT